VVSHAAIMPRFRVPYQSSIQSVPVRATSLMLFNVGLYQLSESRRYTAASLSEKQQNTTFISLSQR
jgi:hypothetical protein